MRLKGKSGGFFHVSPAHEVDALGTLVQESDHFPHGVAVGEMLFQTFEGGVQEQPFAEDDAESLADGFSGGTACWRHR